jgi:hypothetical protein
MGVPFPRFEQALILLTEVEWHGVWCVDTTRSSYCTPLRITHR